MRCCIALQSRHGWNWRCLNDVSYWFDGEASAALLREVQGRAVVDSVSNSMQGTLQTGYESVDLLKSGSSRLSNDEE